MKNTLILLLILPITCLFGQGFRLDPCKESRYQKLDQDLINIMQQIVLEGVPGMVAAVESEGVLSMGSVGMAKIEDKHLCKPATFSTLEAYQRHTWLH
jgi:hypothetical protein